MVNVKENIPEVTKFFTGKTYSIVKKDGGTVITAFTIYNIGVVIEKGELTQLHLFGKEKNHFFNQTIDFPEILNLFSQGVYNSNDNDWKSYVNFPREMLKTAFEGKYIIDEISGSQGKIVTFEAYELNGVRFLDDKKEEITAIPVFSIISSLINDKKFITDIDCETLTRGPGVFIYNTKEEFDKNRRF